MNQRSTRRSLFALPVLALLSVGCSSPGGEGSDSGGIDNDTPLSDLDSLLKDAPDNAKLDELGKADAVYPKLYTELLTQQSPVRNQARRGVCSIFATNGLMEHLYLKAGNLPNPDFSEQFLQWSVKKEVGDFTNTEGSNANSNLEAISQFGIVKEADWPYEQDKWTTANDPECTGESMPTKCYTNGEPPASALAAPRFKLPAGRWVNSKTDSIKAFMTTKKQAVVVGMTFFYQSWNHRLSAIPVDSATYWKDGVVFYPNAKDKSESLKKRAGHAIVLVGWDDDKEIQPLDESGKPAVDAGGTPIKEKGFFIFKNSWGTDRFGTENPYGAGYGYLSFKYVAEYGTVYGADVPKPEPTKEICNDQQDNDGDGKSDCTDSDCAADSACTGAGTDYQNTTGATIPDNDATGVKSDIVVAEGGSISAVSVTVDITHPYRGDLIVKLVRQGGGEVLLSDRAGGSADDLKKTFAVTAFDGQDSAGTWSLVVLDKAKSDVGKLNSWKLSITRGGAAPSSQSYASTESKPIKDNDAAGVSTDIVVADAGEIKALSVTVDVTHPAKGDLNVKLQRIGVGEAVLFEADASSGAFGKQTFSVSEFIGDEGKGTWRLVVADVALGDSGSLNGWSLEIKR
ncbi:MAG: proprotein convertase P-domain-containing protein [Myxococcales bacterium]|nr:proprotein convertase P-domain-containing protein [Myxococcales bacterium]